jgi:hypothetical protein
VAYRLSETLSDRGSVSRSICSLDTAGRLTDCVEHTQIRRLGDGRIVSEHGSLDADAPASLNLFAFHPSVLARLAAEWEGWIACNIAEPEAEFWLPYYLNVIAQRGDITIDVRRTTSRWVGLTYDTDLAAARDLLAPRFAAQEPIDAWAVDES